MLDGMTDDENLFFSSEFSSQLERSNGVGYGFVELEISGSEVESKSNGFQR